MGPAEASMSLNMMSTAHNRAQDRHMTRKGIPHRYNPLRPLVMGISQFKRDVRSIGLPKGVESRLIKRYKERAWADLNELKEAAPTPEEIVLSGQQ